MKCQVIIALTIFGLPINAAAQTTETAEPVCRTGDVAKSLDFWVGEWSVTSRDGGVKFGTNRVERLLDGCAIFENWRSTSGNEGKSLFAFDAGAQKWTQIWVTPNTSVPGGIKRKQLVALFEGGAVRFQGSYSANDGRTIIDRTTLTPEAGGMVRQLIEVSDDGGDTWRIVFDATYKPIKQ